MSGLDMGVGGGSKIKMQVLVFSSIYQVSILDTLFLTHSHMGLINLPYFWPPVLTIAIFSPFPGEKSRIFFFPLGFPGRFPICSIGPVDPRTAPSALGSGRGASGIDGAAQPEALRPLSSGWWIPQMPSGHGEKRASDFCWVG